MKVVVYKNLNLGNWSVAAVKGRRGRGKVMTHLPALVLHNVTFVVQEGSRQTVIKQHCRSVHAWCVGETVGSVPAGRWVAISYNPYRGGSFYRRDNGAALSLARCVRFSASDGAMAII